MSNSATRMPRRLLKRDDALTFGDLFREWYERHAIPKLARAETDDIVYRRHIEKDLGRRVVADIKRIEIGRFRDLLAKRASPHVSDTVLGWGPRPTVASFDPSIGRGLKPKRERCVMPWHRL
jgi:hypothetical protein